jgi:hypothetical protein
MGGRRVDLQNSWEVGDVICKGDFCKSLLLSPLSAPLDQHRVTQIEVSIVCIVRLVST